MLQLKKNLLIDCQSNIDSRLKKKRVKQKPWGKENLLALLAGNLVIKCKDIIFGAF